MESPAGTRRATLEVFRSADFRLYLGARLLLISAGQMLSVAVGWQVYALTGKALHLGLVGLAMFVPNVLLSLVSGTVADRFDRRRIVMMCLAASAGAAVILAWQASRPGGSLVAIYGVSALIGSIRAFSAPAGSSLLPALVPSRQFQSAVAWQMIVFQAATVAGPAAGGLLYGTRHGAAGVYAVCVALYAAAFAAYALMRARSRGDAGSEPFRAALSAGVRYVWREKVLLGAISLDLFAVLLGGATALMPVYAKDILGTGPVGLGILRSAPALGAGVAAAVLAVRPLHRRVGTALFAGVTIFGVATVLFAFSRSLAAATAALAVMGAADMVSVVIRHTLIQVVTPDAMRGRVSAVAFVFIGASNELGEFESGVTAAWWGVVPAVVVGGLGTLAVVALWSLFFPQLRRFDRFEDRPADPRA